MNPHPFLIISDVTRTAVAVAVSARMRKDQVAANVASRKLWCPAHHDQAGAWLPIDQFARNPGRATERCSWCRQCANAAQRARYASDPAVAADRRARAAARRAAIKDAKAAELADRVREEAILAIVAGESPRLFADLITTEDIPELAARRAARIRGQAEAAQQRAIAAAAWRRGSRRPPAPFDDNFYPVHGIGWKR